MAQDRVEVVITIKDHLFVPPEIRVKATTDTDIWLRIKNDDPTVEEFESVQLRVEKIIAGGAEGVVRLRPLAPGRYPFFGEFHSDTARGWIIAE